MKNTGLVMLFTGNGKGKTTAALGQALRAAGHGFRVCIIQFIKKDIETGEARALATMTGLIEMHTIGSGFVRGADVDGEHRQAARAGWELARARIMSNDYQMVILDEFTYPLNFGYLDEKEIVSVIRSRPAGQHLVITGRDAGQGLMAAADLVTEMKEIKHPFNEGIKAGRGVEF